MSGSDKLLAKPNRRMEKSVADRERFRRLFRSAVPQFNGKCVQIWSQRVEIAGKRREERENYTQPNAVSPCLLINSKLVHAKALLL